MIRIGNEMIEEKSSEKLLGVHVKNNFKWEKHIDELERKLRFRLFTLRRLSQKIPRHFQTQTLSALVESSFREIDLFF